jgi:hypothetical protein
MGRPRKFVIVILLGAAAAAIAVVRHGQRAPQGTGCREESSSAIPSSMTR